MHRNNKKIDLLQNRIDSMQDQNISQIINSQLNNRMSEIYDILSTLTQFEPTFTSLDLMTRDFEKLKKQVLLIENSIKSCEALCDVNMSHQTEIQKVILGLNDKLKFFELK